MNNLNQLRDRVFEINKDNGWHKEKRTFGELIALVHSEISEALEDYRNGKAVNEVWYEYPYGKIYDVPRKNICVDLNSGKLEMKLGKPCGIPSELADIIIRILDICGLYEWDIEFEKFEGLVGPLSFGGHIAEMHYTISCIYEAECEGKTQGVSVLIENLIQYIYTLCEYHSINLDEIILEKLEYNATRGYKHGGKVI